MVNINPKKAGIIAVIAVVIPLIAAFFYFTRYNFIPVQVALGGCSMDYTAKPTYEERLSPLISEEFQIKGWEMILCYGQPSLRGREMIGDRIPLDTPWRFGANEPTRFYTSADVEIGGINVPKGRYSLYAVPGRFEWEIFINSSITHWGNNLGSEVQSKNIGSFTLTPGYQREAVETLVFNAQYSELGNDEIIVLMEWENTILEIPIKNLEDVDKTDHTLRGVYKETAGQAEAGS